MRRGPQIAAPCHMLLAIDECLPPPGSETTYCSGRDIVFDKAKEEPSVQRRQIHFLETWSSQRWTRCLVS